MEFKDVHRAKLNSFYSPSCSDSVSVRREEETLNWESPSLGSPPPSLLCLKAGPFVPGGRSRVGGGEPWEPSIKARNGVGGEVQSCSPLLSGTFSTLVTLLGRILEVRYTGDPPADTQFTGVPRGSPTSPGLG